MYRSGLDRRDKGGAIAAVVAIHAALLFLLLQATGRIDLTDPHSPIRVFDVTEAPPPPPPEPVQRQPERQAERPPEQEGAASPENIRSEATPIVDPKPRIELPLPVPMATTETPAEGTQPTQGAADVPGPGTGAGGTGTGTGSGGSGSGTGGGGGAGGDAITPPRLLTPTLTGRDFPRQLIRAWPRGAQVFVRVRVNPQGGVSECMVDRGTGNAAIDSTVCNLVRQRFRYRPALNSAGQPVAGWHGYRQVPPR